MSYRNPRFYFHHAYRSAGSAAIGGSAFDAAFPAARLYDSAIARHAKFNATTANQYVKANRGAGFASLPAPTHLIVPAGHTFAGTTVNVLHKATDPASGTDGTTIFTGAIAAGQQILALSPALSLQYFLVNVPASGTAWEFGELWLSVQRTTTRGPSDDWKDSSVPNVSRQQLDGGETYRLQHGVSRRSFEFTYEGLTGNDLLVFLDLRSETGNGLYPFYLEPPDTTEPPLLVELLSPIIFKQDSKWAGSAAGPTYSTTFTLLECIA